MASKNKKNIKIASATIVSLFSLATVFSATVAWFSLSNSGVTASSMEVKIKTLSGRLDYVEFHDIVTIDESTSSKVYQFDKTAFSTIDYDWEHSTASISNSDIFVMSSYSSLVREHPLLVVFAFDTQYTSSFDGDIFIKGTTEITDFLGAKNADGTPVYPLVPDKTINKAFIKGTPQGLAHDYYASSSVINFRSHAFTSTDYSTLLASDETINIADSLVDTYENFVSINPEDPDDVSFSQKPTIYAAKAGDEMQYIATIVNYYPEAISIIYSTYLGDSTLENTYNGDLYFACDWSLEVF